MRTLLTVIAVLLVVALLFVLIGVLSPGQKSETRVSIHAPIDYTWDVYQDKDQLKEWVPGLKEIALKTRTDGSVGSEYELTIIDPSGKQSTSHQTITAIDKPNRYAIDYHNNMVAGNSVVDFETQGDSTIVIATNTYKGSSLLLRSILHFFEGHISDQTQQQYADLKTLVETRYSENQMIQEELRQDSLQSETFETEVSDTLDL